MVRDRHAYIASLSVTQSSSFHFFFFFNDTATTEIYTLSPTRRSSDLVVGRPIVVRQRVAADDNRRHAVIGGGCAIRRSEEHTSELQSLRHLVCRLLLEKKNKTYTQDRSTNKQITRLHTAAHTLNSHSD